MGTTAFATSATGEVAYRVISGSPGPTIVHVPHGTVPIEVLDEDAMYERFLHTLGRYGRLVVLDRPGIGESDPLDPARDYLDQVAEAYVAVLDELGVSAAWLAMKMGYVAHRLGERHRSRLLGATMLSGATPGSPHPFQARDVVKRGKDISGMADWVIPSRANDTAYAAWHERAGRLGASASAARAYWEASEAAVERLGPAAPPLADALPVLVVHRRGAQTTKEHCRWWMDLFPQSELALLEGADEAIEGLDADTLADTMGAFILGETIHGPEERPMVAMLFTDLVESTAAAVDSGDATWRSKLDQYERALAGLVARHRGTLVKQTGDGALATFASGTRALHAAAELRSTTADLGLRCRTGVHVGEVERRGEDIGGIGVHLAARVMHAAAPGQILMTCTVAQATMGGGFTTRAIGATRLKGIEGEWVLHSLEGASSRP